MKTAETPPHLVFRKNDQDDPRLGDSFTNLLSPNGYALLGYPDDEGIKSNGGRPGASSAPLLIRKYLYRLTSSNQFRPLIDLGNLEFENQTLKEKQSAAADLLKLIYEKGSIPITLGGGHDFGFIDVDSFLTNESKNNPIVINIDAHLDCRPSTMGPHSGNPFRRIKEKHTFSYRFIQLGLGRYCNSDSHIDWAKNNNMQLIWNHEDEDLIFSLLKEKTCFLPSQTPLFISLDLDVLKSSDMPGVSHGFSSGLSVSFIRKVISYLVKNLNLKGIGLYEYSPPLDISDIGAKTTALIIHDILSLKK